jgi:hypothetical protein
MRALYGSVSPYAIIQVATTSATDNLILLKVDAFQVGLAFLNPIQCSFVWASITPSVYQISTSLVQLVAMKGDVSCVTAATFHTLVCCSQ